MLKSKKSRIIVFLIVASLIIVPGIFLGLYYGTDLFDRSTKDISEIYITNDEDFIQYNFTGVGSKINPYSISDLRINTTKKYGIYIEYTSKFFVITNCSITAAHTAIYINHIAEQTCAIFNNTITQENRTGIYVNEATGIIIKDNLIYQNQPDFSPHNAGVGIMINYSDSLSIINNTIRNMSIGISTWYVSGSISDNYLNSCNRGVLSWRGDDGFFITNNTFDFCIRGIELFGLQNTTLQSNIIQNCTVGIVLENCDLCTFIYNAISYCSDYAICQMTSPSYSEYGYFRNIFYNNILINNSYERAHLGYAQAYDESIDSVWYNASLERGNYWSDLIWVVDVSYHIDGPGNQTDIYPLNAPL
ncbi:MAG: hypothetical protein FK734_04540 [Asgard group archaeon]|nr:hypothetical protein [Asgard group archaeon]